MASLFVIRGKYAGKHFSLNRERTTLGRDTTCDIQIVDHEVSRQHAEISLQGTEYHFTDLASSNVRSSMEAGSTRGLLEQETVCKLAGH